MRNPPEGAPDSARPAANRAPSSPDTHPPDAQCADDTHRDLCRIVPMPDGAPPAQMLARVLPTYGEGWMAMQTFDSGLLLSRADYRLHTDYRSTQEGIHCHFGIMLFLSGRYTLRIPSLGTEADSQHGGIWLRSGELDTVTGIQYADSPLRSVALDMPADMLAAWRDDGLLRGHPGLCAGQTPVPSLRQNATTPWHAALAARILSLSGAPDAIQRLELESLSLALLASLLSQDTAQPASLGIRPKRAETAMDSAIDILRAEFATPPTISVLARRVGLNECSLKRVFRERLDTTIGGFVRGERMRQARSLLESGADNIAAVAGQVGYANASQFAAAFRKEFGAPPSHWKWKARQRH